VVVDARDSLGFAVIGPAAIARHLGVTTEEATEMCEARAFPCFRTGGQWAATRRSLDRFLSRATVDEAESG
jgi:hypothetical protein